MTFSEALQLLADNPAATLDLEEVALLFANDEYPDLDQSFYRRQIAGLAREVMPALKGDLENRIAVLADFLFDQKNFQGNSAEYYNPRNSYLNDVLDRRLGIPISLSVLAMVVGRRANLHIVGVGLPGHFIVKAVEDDQEVLFDPYHGGQLLTPSGCAEIVKAVTGQEFTPTPAVFQPVPTGLIMARMLNNLKGIYLQSQDFHRAVRIMERSLILAPDDIMQRRDLGVALVRADRPGAAITHLEAYLGTEPKGEDADLVKKVLKRAKNEVAKWN